MKLIVTDSGDPSVGIFSATYEVDCPFNSDSDKEDLQIFRKHIDMTFSDFSQGNIVCEYDFEIDNREAKYSKCTGDQDDYTDCSQQMIDLGR